MTTRLNHDEVTSMSNPPPPLFDSPEERDVFVSWGVVPQRSGGFSPASRAAEPVSLSRRRRWDTFGYATHTP